MAQVCIWDSMGRKICYQNHAQATTVHYDIVYYEPSAVRGGTTLDGGELRDDANYLQKLKALVDWVGAHEEYKEIFADWRKITRDPNG